MHKVAIYLSFLCWNIYICKRKQRGFFPPMSLASKRSKFFKKWVSLLNLHENVLHITSVIFSFWHLQYLKSERLKNYIPHVLGSY